MFLTHENNVIESMDLDLSEILVSAEESWSEITVAAISNEATLMIAAAQEGVADKPAEQSEGIWTTMKKYAAMVASWFKAFWGKISTFFKATFAKLMSRLQSDDKTIAKMKAHGVQNAKGSYSGKIYETAIFGGLVKGLGLIAKMDPEKPAHSKAVAKSISGKDGDSVKTALLGESKEVKLGASDAGKYFAQYMALAKVGSSLKGNGKLIQSFAKSATKAEQKLAGAISKKDTAGAKTAKAAVEQAKSNASAISAVISAQLSAFGTVIGQARSVCTSLIYGGAPAKKEDNADEGALFNFGQDDEASAEENALFTF